MDETLNYSGERFQKDAVRRGLKLAKGTAMGSKGWRSGESARLPPMWPGFKSRRRRHMWVEFVVVSLLCSERFFSGYSGFPLSSKTNIFELQFDQESGTLRTTFVLPPIHYLFIFYLQTFFGVFNKKHLNLNQRTTI